MNISLRENGEKKATFSIRLCPKLFMRLTVFKGCPAVGLFFSQTRALVRLRDLQKLFLGIQTCDVSNFVFESLSALIFFLNLSLTTNIQVQKIHNG